ncbi:MAG: metal ABC transporter solute-binding protein, Zn/Mn family [Acidimicrobiales bacterium]
MTGQRHRRPRGATAAILLAGTLVVAACSSSDDAPTAASDEPAAPTTDPTTTGSSAAGTGSPAAGSCPTDPIDVVVSVDQWGDIVEQLAGDCATVHVVIASSAVDPHDYEPTSSDALEFDSAELVVVNGAGYDTWAGDLAENAASAPAVVDAGVVADVADGANPHLWYAPDHVTELAQAVTDQMSAISPDAADYFNERHDAWTQDMQGYQDTLTTLQADVDGRRYAATESVFDYTATAVGLTDATPEGFARAAANESDPAPNDIAAFEQALRDGEIDVLIYNTQTEGSIPEQIRQVAEEADVPVVEVTETVAPGASSFEDWQTGQLDRLADALGIDG